MMNETSRIKLLTLVLCPALTNISRKSATSPQTKLPDSITERYNPCGNCRDLGIMDQLAWDTSCRSAPANLSIGIAYSSNACGFHYVNIIAPVFRQLVDNIHVTHTAERKLSGPTRLKRTSVHLWPMMTESKSVFLRWRPRRPRCATVFRAEHTCI